MKVLHISDNGVELILWKTQTKFLMYKTFSNNNLNQKGIGLFITKKPGWRHERHIWSRVNQTWEPHLKIYIRW
jgi:hypothetical protein